MSATALAAPVAPWTPSADGCEFGHALANHLPMVLVALDKLGASPARRRAFAAHYRTVNGLGPPPPPVGQITRDIWTAHLGDRSRETDYRTFFAGELALLGPDRMQQTYLPTLLQGVAASALHALMRLAYAHLAQDPAEIATALGYWAATYLKLPSGAGTPDTDDPAAVLTRLQAMPHLREIVPETDLLWHAMRAVGADPAFAAQLDRLRTNLQSLPTFAAAALALFAGAPSFCALHAVTAIHWVRLIPAHVIDQPAALRHVWRALAAVYPKMGMPALPSADALAEMRATPCPSWETIAAAAVASDDEHDHSFVFSARAEASAWGDRLYRVVAARRVGLIA